MERNYRSFLKWVVLVMIVVVATFVVVKRDWISDFWRGLFYKPTSEVANIQDKLGLTEHGEFLFKASQPILSESEEFNDKCRFEQDGGDAIVGCYTDKNIYVYNIKNQELDGIRECTMAHELLHAVWDRMSDNERESYYEPLSQVLKQNGEYLEEELEIYDETAKREELYVRAGTEIKNLPDDLEKHFATIFKDQDKVVSFYDKYISVFRNLQAELDALEAEMNEIKSQINTKEEDYKKRAEQLNASIAEFNSCAETAGCFVSEWTFAVQRNRLIAEQQALQALYDEISKLIDEYNAKVDKYNEDVISSNKLNQMINSTTEINELELEEE